MIPDYSKAVSLFKKLSQDRLDWLINSQKVEIIEDVNPNLSSFNRWLCLIQLSHQDFRFVFKCHFGEDFCTYLKKKSVTAEDLPHCFDQVRELCNLVMGAIKLSMPEMRVGVSLPLILGGFDEIFLRTPQTKLNFFNVWSVKSEQFQIHFSVEALIFNDEVLKILADAFDSQSVSNAGETELF